MKKIFVICMLGMNVQLLSMDQRKIEKKKLELAVEQDVLKRQIEKLRHLDFNFYHPSTQNEIWKAWMKEKIKTEANILRLNAYLTLVDAPAGSAVPKP